MKYYTLLVGNTYYIYIFFFVNYKTVIYLYNMLLHFFLIYIKIKSFYFA